MRDEGTGRVVHDHPSGAELGELARLFDQSVGLVRSPRAVDETRVECASGVRDCGTRLTEIGDVVERIVQAEHLDAVFGSTGDEPADDVARNRARADEEPAPKGDPERRLHTRLAPADPLPRTLDPATNRRVKDTPAGNLEARETRPIQDLGDV
jgi:hypothetical protein